MKIEFHIEGTDRASRAADIKWALAETADARSVDVTFVEFDDETVQHMTLVKKIQDLGYQATIGDQQRKGATQ